MESSDAMEPLECSDAMKRLECPNALNPWNDCLDYSSFFGYYKQKMGPIRPYHRCVCHHAPCTIFVQNRTIDDVELS